MLLKNKVDFFLNFKCFSFHLAFFLLLNSLNFARKANLKISTQTNQHVPLAG